MSMNHTLNTIHFPNLLDELLGLSSTNYAISFQVGSMVLKSLCILAFQSFLGEIHRNYSIDNFLNSFWNG